VVGIPGDRELGAPSLLKPHDRQAGRQSPALGAQVSGARIHHVQHHKRQEHPGTAAEQDGRGGDGSRQGEGGGEVVGTESTPSLKPRRQAVVPSNR
jgi:hypothetical protein